ncbi:MAG: hypothetical protein E6109_13800, partial [Ruminococcus sp.]|nr:hypothetical protein [Ruminococcus sp.]
IYLFPYKYYTICIGLCKHLFCCLVKKFARLTHQLNEFFQKQKREETGIFTGYFSLSSTYSGVYKTL